MLFSKIAVASDYGGSYFQLDDGHWYSVTRNTRVPEVGNYGEASECRLAEGTGTGFIWRLDRVAASKSEPAVFTWSWRPSRAAGIFRRR